MDLNLEDRRIVSEQNIPECSTRLQPTKRAVRNMKFKMPYIGL